MTSEIRVNKIANRAGLSTVEYTDTGIIVSGIVTCTEISGLNALNVAGVSTFANPLDINGDIDVDGHTNLDNLSVAGVSTFNDNVRLLDGDRLQFGNSQDISIFHNGSHTLINKSGSGTGDLIFNIDQVIFKDTTGTDERLATNSKGIKVGTGVTIETNGQATYTGIVTASHFYGNGANLSALNASNISSGTVPSARLGSGTASSSTFLAGDSTFKTVTGTTINNNADNRIITGSGTANTLEGEANLTFNGGATGDAQLTVHAAEANANSDSELILETSNDFATSVIMFKDSTAEAGSVAYNHGDNYIKFSTNGTNGGTERVRITSNGNVKIGSGSAAFGVGGGLEIDTGSAATIRLEDSGSTSSFEIQNTGGVIKQNMYNNQPWTVAYNSSEKLRINSSGHVTVNATSYQALTITTSENGTNGPEIQLMHNSASPAANDTIGQLRYSGKDSAGDTTLFSKIETKATTVTNGSETGHIDFSTRGGGAYNSMFRLSARGTASAPSYTTDDMNGIILDTYNTGNPYPRYFNFIAKAAGNTDSNIGFWTEAVGGSPTQKMTIDASGTITTPLQPIFATRIDYVNSYLNSGVKVAMRAAHIDTRSSFSDANDRYVAPAAGRYLFYFYSNIDYNGDGTIAVIFKKNGADFTGSEGGHIYSYAQNAGWHLLSGQIITNMAVNDYIEVFRTANNMKVDGNSYGQFGGYMIG